MVGNNISNETMLEDGLSAPILIFIHALTVFVMLMVMDTVYTVQNLFILWLACAFSLMFGVKRMSFCLIFIFNRNVTY